MDLGQLLCTPRQPDCGACPLRAGCAARRTGAVARFPRKKPRPPTSRIFVAAAAAQENGRVLLVLSTQELLRGLWLFPCAQADSPARALERLRVLARGLGLLLARGGPIGQTRHTMGLIEEIVKGFGRSRADYRLIVAYFTSKGTPAETEAFIGAIADCVKGPLPPITVVPQPHMHSSNTLTEIWAVAEG